MSSSIPSISHVYLSVVVPTQRQQVTLHEGVPPEHLDHDELLGRTLHFLRSGELR